MNLHIFIAGKERLNMPVPAHNVPWILGEIDVRLEEMEKQGKVVVTLDSEEHSNLTYLLKPRFSP